LAVTHYNTAQLADALRASGIGPGDIVSLQASLGRLGLPADVALNYASIGGLVIDTFLDVLGPSGTLIVPTYSYSIGRGEIFDVENTPSGIGEFSELFRTRYAAVRSRDPMVSSAAVGPLGRDVLRNISQSCYGEGSTFENLRRAKAKICCLGISLYWATFRHHIEQLAQVPFRFVKTFTGIVRENNVDVTEAWTYFAAPQIPNCEPFGLPMERKAREAGLVRVMPIGRGEIMTIVAGDYFDFGIQVFAADPWLTAKGPPAPPEEIFRDEPQYWQQRR
jgi:aminoglycoside 3-N-acetyltransferase